MQLQRIQYSKLLIIVCLIRLMSICNTLQHRNISYIPAPGALHDVEGAAHGVRHGFKTGGAKTTIELES